MSKALSPLRKDYREQLSVMADFAEEIESKLDSPMFDKADPSLEPGLGEARRHAGRLRAFLGELCFLSETEHGL